jgi:biopolymer transport protein ExbD
VADQKHIYDIWLVKQNLVYKEVPFQVITDWVQQARIGEEDMLKSTGTQNWIKLKEMPLFSVYLSPPSEKAEDVATALEPIELDFNWKRPPEEDDEDVDMIPLIDISLVLLIFFMMTTTVAAISNITVPEVANGAKIESDPEVITLQIDYQNNQPIYGLARGNLVPEGANANLTEEGLIQQLDTELSKMTRIARITIAAHQDLTYDQVERVMKAIDQRIARGIPIERYSIQVGQKAR